VPTSFLIGRDGRILWRGHPASINLERKLEELLAKPVQGGRENAEESRELYQR
jgi:hypothetical protein